MKRWHLRNMLEHPRVYTFSQALCYRRGQQQAYVDNWVRPRPQDRILDIGCGPADVLKRLPSVRYVGYEPNPRCVKEAVKRFGDRGVFRLGHLTQLPDEEKQTFDIAMASGVLHHLSDDQVNRLMSATHDALKTGGRLITRDGCYEERQSWLVRVLLRHDRGAFVRTRQHYEALFREYFHILRVEILRAALRYPYSLIHFEAVKRA